MNVSNCAHSRTANRTVHISICLETKRIDCDFIIDPTYHQLNVLPIPSSPPNKLLNQEIIIIL